MLLYCCKLLLLSAEGVATHHPCWSLQTSLPITQEISTLLVGNRHLNINRTLSDDVSEHASTAEAVNLVGLWFRICSGSEEVFVLVMLLPVSVAVCLGHLLHCTLRVSNRTHPGCATTHKAQLEHESTTGREAYGHYMDG